MPGLHTTQVKQLGGITLSPYSTTLPDNELQGYVSEIIGDDISNILWLHSDSSNTVPPLHDQFSGIGNLQLLNNILDANKFLRKVNVMLDKNGYFILLVETKKSRKSRIYGNYSKIARRPVYIFDFLWKRVVPKTFLRGIYFAITRGKKQVVSLSEALARLIFCGFEIIDHKQIGNKTVIISKKIQLPYRLVVPTTGILIKLPRVGFNKEIISVYKIRTMHPYSEFLQEYLFDKYGTKDGDKIENDFRVTRWGKFFRKYWIDEIPMLLNLVKGDLKIIGVRPLSRHKFYTYPDDLQRERVNYKPGLIPPYYADLPETQEEFFESEKKYLRQYQENPLKTDLKYLGKFIYNIIFKGVRSK